MPAATKPKPKATAKAKDAEVVYPEITVNGVKIPEDKLVLTEAMVDKILGWETEADYAKRLAALPENRAKKISADAIGYGDDFLLTDFEGNKIRCHRNSKNRPFDEQHAYKLAQDHLDGAFKLNCETIIVSDIADVESGQHRLISYKLACQMWRKNPKSYPKWKNGPPVLRSLIVFGASHDPDVVRTIDNVKPRSLTDVFYTSPIFASLGKTAKLECSRMMDYCVDLLWKRTGMGTLSGEKHYQTHSASIEFVEHHPQVKQFIKQVFDNNAERQISSLKLSAGHVAAMGYLMAASGDDEAAEDYFAHVPHNEKRLNLDLWPNAEEFIAELASVDREEDANGRVIGFSGKLAPVVEALVALVDPDGDDGAQGRTIEKLAVLTRAWIAWRDKGEVTADDVDLSEHYHQDPETKVWGFVNEPTCGGIDRGSGKTGADRQLEREAVEKAKEEAKAEKQAKLDAKAKGGVTTVTTAPVNLASELKEQFAKLAATYPGMVVLHKNADSGDYGAWLDDAVKVAAVDGQKPAIHEKTGLPYYKFKKAEFDRIAGKLQAAGTPVGIAVYNRATKGYDVVEANGNPSQKPQEAQDGANGSEGGGSPTPSPKAAPKPKEAPKTALRGGVGSAPVPKQPTPKK